MRDSKNVGLDTEFEGSMVTAPVKLDATNAVATTTVKVQPHRPPLQRGGMLPVEGAENSCTHPNMTQTAENQMSANTQRYCASEWTPLHLGEKVITDFAFKSSQT